ncbi:hypothetical protein, partial [Ralstonia pseudosolanacearum]|uniref:hypothetical protein n=1 Tax=Ralstonia pseudosolanacearum TaxID=1310165 RepID=UPI001981C7DC
PPDHGRLGAAIMPGLAGQSPDYWGTKIVTGAAAMLIGLIFAIAELFRRKKGLSLFRISWGFFCCCQWPCSPSL